MITDIDLVFYSLSVINMCLKNLILDLVTFTYFLQ